MANGKIKNSELHIGWKLAIWIAGIISLGSVAYATIFSNRTDIECNRTEIGSVRKAHQELKDEFLEFRGEWKAVAQDIKVIKAHLVK